MLIISDEDGYADSLGPRLKRQGANLQRCHFFDVQNTQGEDVQLDVQKHVSLLDGILKKYPNTRLLVFDPLSAFLGQADSNSNSDVRRVLGPIGKLDMKHGVAVLGINHFRKSEGRAVSRTVGSVAFTAKCRVEWQAGIHPDYEQRQDAEKLRLFLPAKNNLGAIAGLSYRIRGAKNKGVLHWNSEPVYESVQILGRKPEMVKKIDQAIELIEDELKRNGGRVSVESIKSKAGKLGIGEETVRRAKRVMKVKPQRDDDGNWFWFDEGVNPDTDVVVTPRSKTCK